MRRSMETCGARDGSQADISKLLAAKLGLESDKITERKKSATCLQEMLDRGHILDYIHQQSRYEAEKTRQRSKAGSSRGPVGVVTWSSLFRSVLGFISKEIEAIQRLEEKGTSSSASVLANRNNKKQDVTEMLRVYIRAVNKKGDYQHLLLSEILGHVKNMMVNKRTKDWATENYTHILLKEILPVSHYALLISSTQWEGLLAHYFELYFTASAHRPLVAKTIRTLLSHSAPQCDLPLHSLYLFYTKAFATVSEEKDWKLLEDLLAGLCTFFRVAASNGRSRLCSLGEDIWSSILHLWSRVPALKDNIIKFMRIQLRIHHPGGRVREEEGAWCRSDPVWRSNLEALYQQILKDYESSSNRLRRTSGYMSEGAVGQNFDFLDLSADVMYLVMSLRELNIPILDCTSPKAKRSRKLSCWEVLREGLSSSSDVSSTTSWLQLITWLIVKWPACLPASDYLPLLSLLQTLLRNRESKRVECSRWVLICTCALALHPVSSTQASEAQTRLLWKKIWHSTLKLLTVHCAEKEGYSVLCVLLRQGWVDPDLGQWQLYNATYNQPSNSNVCFLACFLASHPLPESVGPSVPSLTTHFSATQTQSVSGLESTAACSYPLRSQLLHFLLPPLLEVNRSLSVMSGALCRLTDKGQTERSPPSVVVLSHVLVGLTQRTHGSAQLSFLRQFYHPQDIVSFFHELLDPSFTPATVSMATPPATPLTTPPVSGDFIKEWAEVEKILLQSTFDEPLFVPCLQDTPSEQTNKTYSRESTIASLQALLLQLLAKRSESLLQPMDIEILSSSRERSHQLHTRVMLQAEHCCLILHTILLLCLAEAFSNLQQLKGTQAIRTLPQLLKAVEQHLLDPAWNDVERSYYHKTCGQVCAALLPLLSFPHLLPPGGHTPSSPHKALGVVKKLCALSLPDSLLKLMLELAEGKWPVPQPALSSSSLAGSVPSSSLLHTRSRSASVDFEDDELPDSVPSSHSDFSSGSSAGPHDILTVSSLCDKTWCQLQAALFLCHVYISEHALLQEEASAITRRFEVKKAMFSVLTEHDKSKPVYIQISFRMIETLCEDQRLLEIDLLDAIVQVISEILTIHRKNQTVYREGLSLLSHLLHNLAHNTDPSLGEVRGQFMSVVSGFWTLYNDQCLAVSVRLSLVKLLTSLHSADRDSTWTHLTPKKRKKSDTQDSQSLTVPQAVVRMVNDVDHAVRMHVAACITSLFIATTKATNQIPGLVSHDVVLLSRQNQNKMFKEVLEVLKLAYLLPDGVDELSAEDESVNRIASRVYTLLLMGCVSPVCERKVVKELILAVGNGSIDAELVAKALHQLSVYVGYKGPCQLLETLLLSLVRSWKEEGHPLQEFPYDHLGYSSLKDFFKAYMGRLVPYLVFATDEEGLTVVSQVLDCPVASLLRECLASCMVLIVTCWAQGEGQGEEQRVEIREQATASHELLCNYMSNEEINRTLLSSIDAFVIALLVRIFEPHTTVSHLTQFSLASDPEPCTPHYTSHVIRATFDYMPSCYGSSAAGTPFVRLLAKRNDTIQRILLSLAVKIQDTHRTFEKRRLLLAYDLLVRLLCKELEEEGGGLEDIRSFIIMDVIHTVVRILTSGNKGGDEAVPCDRAVLQLFPLCADVLETLCLAVLRACPEELTPHLHTLVTTLMPFGRHISTQVGKQALGLLSSVLEKVSPQAVTRLDPFPNTEPFTRLHQKQSQLYQEGGGISLSERVEQFLSAGNKSLQSVRMESLKCLQKSLQESKYDIPYLLKQGSCSPLLRLLHHLVDLCPASSSPSVTTSHVSRVLGAIGPRDLGCIALPTTREGGVECEYLASLNDPKLKLFYCLAMLLLDKDIAVVKATGECLREVMASKTGSLVLSKLEEKVEEEVDSDVLWWCRYLQPFKPQKKKKSAPVSSIPFNSSSFVSAVDIPELWLPMSGAQVSHSVWLTKLVITLLSSGGVSDEVLTLITPVCRVKVELCEEIFPLIIHDILCSGVEDLRVVLSRHVRRFFSAVHSSSRPSSPFQPHPSSSGGCGVHPDSIRTMLNMVMYLRTVNRPKPPRSNIASNPWDNNFWLDLNFLDVARAAQRCSAYFTSLLYIEIWHGAKDDLSNSGLSRSEQDDDSDEEVMVIEPARPIGSRTAEDVSDMQCLLLEAYRHIGEPDSVYGACSTHVADHTTRLLLYEHEGEWHKSLNTYNLLMEVPCVSSRQQVAECLHQLGLSHVLRHYLCGVRGVEGEGMGGEEMEEYLYESAWRCTRWEEGPLGAVGVGLGGGKKGYHQHLFNCMANLKDGEMSSLQHSLSEARFQVIQSLCSAGLESTYDLYPSLSKSLCLLEIEEASAAHALTTEPGHTLTDLAFLQEWQDRLMFLDSDFQFVEPVLAVRGSVLHQLLQVGVAEASEGGSVGTEERRKVEGIFEALKKTLLTHSKRAREAAKYQVCERALFSLKQLQSQCSGLSCVSSSLYSSLPWTLQSEEAKLYWERGEKASAMALLSKLLDNLKLACDTDFDAATLYPASLSLYGNWLAETRSKSPSEVITDYLEKSVALMDRLRSTDKIDMMEAYLTLACYADSQYRRIQRHMESSAFEDKKQLLQKYKAELQKVESNVSVQQRMSSRSIRTMQSQSKEDELALTNLLAEKHLFLQKALRNYMLCLRAGDDHDLRIFRICGLWFANSTDHNINAIIKEGASQLEKSKFIPLMYQLAARMSSKSPANDTFQEVLQEVILSCTVEHPYHCLYIILALSNATKDNLFPKSGYVTGSKSTTSGRLSRKSAPPTSIDEDKVKAAKDLLSKLRRQKPSLVKSVEQLCDAYIDLAYYDVSSQKTQRGPIKLPTSCPLLKLKERVVIPTVDLAVDRICQYNDAVYIQRFEPYFQLAGGVNLPKIVTCVGSDGKRRRQLIKGKDDLRQDAVMQQIFVLVNRLLQRDASTSKRKLCIRTYNVIPLSQRSGVVEWCEKTRPLGEYLVGLPPQYANSAHSRYRPFDWTSLNCRKKIFGASSKSTAYAEICRMFRPVFHHFFMESFPTPPQWFERRLAYTRSVAASSMVGYMVGLGDRHVQNILIDTNTAEFIHIDLGVAFEQGKTLPTPETVPFRLTRDIVDGMGIAGVEGVFRRCCEKTMALMRAHQEELRTIVEVLLHDPLYQWTLSPLKALNLQCRTEHGEETSTAHTAANGDIFQSAHPHKGGSDLNKMAERVLIRLQEKLEGIEDGVPLSVSGQVNHLIQEATDPDNLCVLFAGWQPWI